ncbi:MAG: ribonuclease HI family protein [Thermoplasmata archaeon]
MAMALLPRVLLYTDGGARRNPGPAAIGIVICDAFGNVLLEHRESIGRATNNEAEYRALIRGLDLAARHTRGRVTAFSDSHLLVSQLNGEFKIKEPRLVKLAAKVRQKTAPFQEVTFEHVPRSHRMIRRADDLVNRALDERYGRG